jgi:hypothetical protein
VGSLPPSDHPDLLAVAKSRYRFVDKARFSGLSAFETTKAVFGTERRVVVTHSQNLHDKQSAGFDQTRKSRDDVKAEIAAILGPQVHPGSAAPQRRLGDENASPSEGGR